MTRDPDPPDVDDANRAMPAGDLSASAPCTTQARYSARVDAITRLNELLDQPSDETVGTSMRLSTALRDAAAIAVRDLGVASSVTELTADALRRRLEAVAMQAALDAHYAEHPQSRPTLADLAIAAAQIDGNPLADQPKLIRRAAAAVAEAHPDEADADMVLLWAEALASVAA